MTFNVGDTFEIERVPFYRVTGLGHDLGLGTGLWAVGVRLPDNPPDDPDMLVPVADGVGKFIICVVHVGRYWIEYQKTIIDPDGVSHDADNGRTRDDDPDGLSRFLDRCQGTYFRADINKLSMPAGAEQAN